MTEPDPREQKLPAWARQLISGLRGELALTLSERDAAREEATAAAGRMSAEDAPVKARVGETTIGLPANTLVDFGDISVSLGTRGGVDIETIGRSLAVFPEHDAMVRIRKVAV